MILLNSKSRTAPYSKTIVYGESKTGKTRMVARLAKYHKLLWFDTENSLSTLLNPENLDPQYLKNINYIGLPDTVDEPIAANTLSKVFSFIPVSICNEHGIIDCPTCKKAQASFESIDLRTIDKSTIIVVDSLTQLVTSWINVIAKGKPPEFKFTFAEWHTLGQLGRRFLTNIQACKLSIIVTSRVLEVEQEDGTKKLYPEGGTRNFSSTVPGFFDNVVYTHMKGKAHAYGSSSTDTTTAIVGSRWGKAVELADSKAYTPLELIYPPVQSESTN